MKRRFPVYAAAAMVVVACAASPPPRAPLPDVGEVLDPPSGCSFLVGEPEGVLVQEVLPDSAADGVLMAGDVIVAFEDAPTPDSESLLAALSDNAPGDTVEIEYRRDDQPATASVTLGEEEGRPRIGVMIRTQYQAVAADDVDTEVSLGPLVRPMSIVDVVYLLDPSGPAWENTGIEVPEEGSWVATASGIFSLQDAVVVDESTDKPVADDDFDGWDPIRLIGSLGDDLIMVVTRELSENPEQVAVAVSRFDPEEGVTAWVTPVIAGSGIPVTALGSPSGETMVVVGVDEGGANLVGIDVWSGGGEPLDVPGLLELGTPVGWMDDGTILFRTALETVTLFSSASGAGETAELEPAIGGLPLYPVGDGSRVLAVDDRSLLLDDLEQSGDVRLLAENCAITRVGEPGWRG